ncbi:MAG TPA: GDP-mannose 4,6-dehydratase [Candidatus Angelobacter sp.]
MNILITGGAGFIGSHLAEQLLDRGDQVSIVDDLSTGSTHNIRHLKTARNLQCFFDTVTDRQLMSSLVDAADMVYHLAAAVGVRLIVERPRQTVDTNIRGTEVILELAARKKTRVLIASTSEVYGKRNHVPFRESDDLILGPPDKVRWIYACSKLLDEFLALAYWKEKRVPTVVARLFNVVGPRQTGQYGMVIPNLIAQALSGSDMTVFGDGLQRRCFTHVSDAVTALIALAEHPQANGEIYNVGSTEEISILQLAEKIKKITASDSKIVFVPYVMAYGAEFEDVVRRVPDLTKIQQTIGCSPRMNLHEILADTIKYHREQPAFASGKGQRRNEAQVRRTGLIAAEA